MSPEVYAPLQGDPLSPMLFNAYIFNIMDYLTASSLYTIKLHLTETHGLLSADDLAMLAIHVSLPQMQKKLDRLAVYFDSLNLNINLDKTKFLIFLERSYR